MARSRGYAASTNRRGSLPYRLRIVAELLCKQIARAELQRLNDSPAASRLYDEPTGGLLRRS
ncbi:hypothetical protein [Streptomyces sp. URMC 124]|uniref:hypothetical protein n=1 Tax=Streptomyces sp. URMC 124 TaxID=3423405 RepID=UPI003F192E7C